MKELQKVAYDDCPIIVLVILAFTLMGYAFDEIMNPKLKER